MLMLYDTAASCRSLGSCMLHLLLACTSRQAVSKQTLIPNFFALYREEQTVNVVTVDCLAGVSDKQFAE